MPFDSRRTKDVFYQYFWVKVADNAEVDRQRAAQLMTGPDSNGFYQPMISDVYPASRPSSPLVIAQKKADVHLGFEIKPAEALGKGYVLDLRMARPGYTLEEARRWIGTDDGIKWKGNSLVVLGYVAVVPVALGPVKRAAQKGKATTTARKKGAAKARAKAPAKRRRK